MRLIAWLCFPIVASACVSASVLAQSHEDALSIYAVNVVKTPPFEKQITGYGIYLGQGMVITAAHVVGHWPSFTTPRILIAGQDLPAKIIKQGSFEDTDLALLSVNEERLPVELRLRRNPICKEAPKVGTNVVVVYPERTVRSRIISVQLIAPQYRAKYSSLIDEPEGSGSGVFHAEKKCLLGIISSKISKYNSRKLKGPIIVEKNEYAGHFVPASTITDFIPLQFRF